VLVSEEAHGSMGQWNWERQVAPSLDCALASQQLCVDGWEGQVDWREDARDRSHGDLDCCLRLSQNVSMLSLSSLSLPLSLPLPLSIGRIIP